MRQVDQAHFLEQVGVVEEDAEHRVPKQKQEQKRELAPQSDVPQLLVRALSEEDGEGEQYVDPAHEDHDDLGDEEREVHGFVGLDALLADDSDVHPNHAEVEDRLECALTSASAVAREERVAQGEVEVDADEQLDAQVDEGKRVDLAREEHNHDLEVLVDDFVVDVSQPEYREVVGQEYVDLARAHDHAHEPEVNGCLDETSSGNVVVGIDFSEAREDVEPDRRHQEPTKREEVQEKPRLEPPRCLGLRLEHPRYVPTIVVDVAPKTLIPLLAWCLKELAVALIVLLIDGAV